MMTLFEQLYWREPLWTIFSLLPILFIVVNKLRQRQQWKHIADESLLPWVRGAQRPQRDKISRVLITVAWLLFCIALAGPRTAKWIPPSLQSQNVSVVMIVDMSNSMKAKDQRQNRLSQTTDLLRQWLTTAPAASRIGLVIFGGHAHTLLNPTNDHHLVEFFLDELVDMQTPTLGNNVADSMKLAAELLKNSENKQYAVLLSDGDFDADALQTANKSARESLRKNDISFHIIGIGGNEPVSVPNHSGEPIVLDGKRVVSRLQGSALKQLALEANGHYQSLLSGNQKTLEQSLNLPKHRLDPSDSDQILWHEWFVIPLLTGLFLLLLALHLGSKNSITRKHGLSLVVFMLLSGCEPATWTNNAVNNISRLLEAGDYSAARIQAGKLDGYAARFVEGVSCYRLADLSCAVEAFSRAAWIAEDAESKGRAVFNLANTYFKLADYDQATVLYRDAEKLGILAELTDLNRGFSESLAASVKQLMADNRETERRANWRTNAGTLPEGFENTFTEGIYLSQPSSKPEAYDTVSKNAWNAMVKHGVGRLLGTEASSENTASGSWVKSTETPTTEDTAGLLNRLMLMEIGMPSMDKEPFLIEGQRAW